MSAIASNDDRVRRIITDPVGYFAEAKARAKRQVRAEMEREAQLKQRRPARSRTAKS